MKKILSFVFAVLAIVPLFTQENTLDNTLYGTTATMKGGNFDLLLKEAGPISKNQVSAGGWVLDADPFAFKDFIPPSQPDGVEGAALDAKTIRLTYLASTDNVHVAGYQIYRDGQKVAFSSDESYTDTGLNPMTIYRYNVQAVDKSWNMSELSDTVTVTTLDLTTQNSPPHFLSGPDVTYAAVTTATIAFETDKATNAIVEYGKTTAYGNAVAAADFVGDHIVSLTGLDSNAKYHYRVTINDFGGHSPVTSRDDTFYTSFASDRTPPDFTVCPTVAYVADTVATITFSTDEDAIGSVTYGKESPNENREEEPFYGRDHSITLSHLQPLTKYSFTVSIMDRAGNGPVTSRKQSFRTARKPDTQPPEITRKKPDVEYLADRGAIITWETDEISDSVVKFGTTRHLYDRMAADPVFTTHHSVILWNLAPHEEYRFIAFSTDPSGNVSPDTMEKQFTTFKYPDKKPPKITRVEIRAGYDWATIRWDTDELASSRVLYGRDSGVYTDQRSDVDFRDEHMVKLRGLLPGTKYYFQVFGEDLVGNEGQTQQYVLRTTTRMSDSDAGDECHKWGDDGHDWKDKDHDGNDKDHDWNDKDHDGRGEE
jgi:chitodextrinase